MAEQNQARRFYDWMLKVGIRRHEDVSEAWFDMLTAHGEIEFKDGSRIIRTDYNVAIQETSGVLVVDVAKDPASS